MRCMPKRIHRRINIQMAFGQPVHGIPAVLATLELQRVESTSIMSVPFVHS